MKLLKKLVILFWSVIFIFSFFGCSIDSPIENLEKNSLEIGIVGDGIVQIDGKNSIPGQKYLVEPDIEVILKAIPLEGSTFLRWDNTNITNPEIKVKMDTSKIVIAIFAEKITTYEVTFADPANGSLKAEVDGAEISSGAQVEAGKDVIFTVTPDQDYRVKEWKVNDIVVPGETDLTYTYPSLDKDIEVEVFLEEIPVVNSISVETQPKLEYTEGQELDLSLLVVELFWSDGSSEQVGFADFANKDLTASPDDGTMLTEAEHNGEVVTITHGESGVTTTTDELKVEN